MKKVKIIFLCVIGILISNSLLFAQNQEQQKYNLNFNAFDSINQVLPNGWFTWGDFKNISVEKLADKNYVGKVTSDDNGKFGCITYSIPANYIGKTITLSGNIKHENVRGYVGLLLRVDGFSGSLAFDNMGKQKINGTNDWKRYAIKLPYPSGAEKIYVGGILVGKGTAWFDNFKIMIDDKPIENLKEAPKTYLKDFDSIKLNTSIENSSTSISLSTDESLSSSFDPLISKIGDKKIVSIGESTHGTSEFYKIRATITKRLIQEKGFNTVVLENPYDDIELLDKNLMTIPIDSLMKKHLFSIYQTEEMKSFLQWYKDNRSEYNIQFKGCDDSYWVFYELLVEKLRDIKDGKLKKLMKKLKSNIENSSTTNLKHERKFNLAIYDNFVSIENHLKLTKKLTQPIEELLFNVKNSYINYIHLENKKPIQSRDEIMADRISYLAKQKDSKVIVWAHNAHISNEIIMENEIGLMGRDLKQEYGNNYHSIGLTTLNGSYSFIDQKFINGDHIYTDKLIQTNIQSDDILLWENILATQGNSFYFNSLELNNELKSDKILGPTKLIGYKKERKRDIYQVPLLKLFDSLIFIKNTNATTPLFNVKM